MRLSGSLVVCVLVLLGADKLRNLGPINASSPAPKQEANPLLGLWARKCGKDEIIITIREDEINLSTKKLEVWGDLAKPDQGSLKGAFGEYFYQAGRYGTAWLPFSFQYEIDGKSLVILNYQIGPNQRGFGHIYGDLRNKSLWEGRYEKIRGF